MVIRITYQITPVGHNSPVTRISCGHPADPAQLDAWLLRYGQYAARQFPGATCRLLPDGSAEVTRHPADGILASVTVEPECRP